MKKKDFNWVVKIERAIAEKYGDIAIQNPRAYWNEEKENSYLEQIKERYKKDIKQKESAEKINKDGFFVSKKLLTKDEDRVCPACFEYSFNLKDDLYMNKYDCCWKCYVQFVERREERWIDIDQRVEFLGNFYKGKDNG
jgi:hypothetical protein|tara:strand:- start:931 stop:1347 length:417 start_codon:yes stop_codon:yes gene_type:complete